MTTERANKATKSNQQPKPNVEPLSLSVMVRFQNEKYAKALNHIATEKKVNNSGPYARIMLEKQLDRWAKQPANLELAKEFGFTE